MEKPWLLIDGNFLCWRAYYALKGSNLSHGGEPTDVIYGFLRDVAHAQDKFQTPNVAIAFDVGFSIRREIYPNYKKPNGKAATVEEMAAKQLLRNQIDKLREKYLPKLGYKNVFWQQNYEGDDILASLVASHFAGKGQAIIFANDHDLYQLLSPSVTIWNGKRLYTVADFQTQYGISPSQWADVKAMAGCSGDNVEGISGVGDITAAKFLTGQLKGGTVKYRSIVSLTGQAIWKRNYPVVRLPYPKTETFKLRDNKVTVKKWRKLAIKLEMTTLIHEPPITTRWDEDNGRERDGKK